MVVFFRHCDEITQMDKEGNKAQVITVWSCLHLFPSSHPSRKLKWMIGTRSKKKMISFKMRSLFIPIIHVMFPSSHLSTTFFVAYWRIRITLYKSVQRKLLLGFWLETQIKAHTQKRVYYLWTKRQYVAGKLLSYIVTNSGCVLKADCRTWTTSIM